VPLHGLNRGTVRQRHQVSGSSLTSFKNNHVTMKQNAQNVAENRHGRRYGCPSQNQFLNMAGNLSCGRESDPPAKGLLNKSENSACCPPGVTYPIVTPTAHTRGRSPNTWAWFVESVSSPTMLLTTAMFPLNNPATHRLAKRSAMVSSRRHLADTSLQGQRGSWRDRNSSWIL
jgi:hypothetical protein